MARSPSPYDHRMIMRVDAHILDIQPEIFRTIELPIDFNLAQLHDILQVSFGWTDSHLHQFNIGGLIYSAPEFFEEGLPQGSRLGEATEIRMNDFQFLFAGDGRALTIFYEYDFGDCWVHALRLERVPREEGVRYPRCSAGSRSAPPEDVGGVRGYERFLRAWSDPDDEDHKALRRWAGPRFDPERCDLEQINKAIARVVRAAGGDYRFRKNL